MFERLSVLLAGLMLKSTDCYLTYTMTNARNSKGRLRPEDLYSGGQLMDAMAFPKFTLPLCRPSSACYFLSLYSYLSVFVSLHPFLCFSLFPSPLFSLSLSLFHRGVQNPTQQNNNLSARYIVDTHSSFF